MGLDGLMEWSCGQCCEVSGVVEKAGCGQS